MEVIPRQFFHQEPDGGNLLVANCYCEYFIAQTSKLRLAHYGIFSIDGWIFTFLSQFHFQSQTFAVVIMPYVCLSVCHKLA